MLKKLFIYCSFGAVAALTFPSCYYDNEIDLYGSNTCDTTAVSYANQIVPILQNNCYGCHDASNVSVSGSQFDSHLFLLDYVNSGSLSNRINDASNPMPPGELMDECNRAKIDAWINAGAPNN